MIKFSTNLLLNPAEIRISGIKCSFNNIVKISTVFEFKWIVVTIDSVKKGSSFLTLVKDQGLKSFERPRSAGYVEISAVVPYLLFEDFLDKAMKENPENIFVFNLLERSNRDIHLQCSFEDPVASGIANVFISISFDESALLISMNKFLIQPQKLYREIKALRLD